MKYLISGGGTGGHIFPAISIANALKEVDPDAEIMFVGALGRMEMEKVPASGYEIIGLPVAGFNRKNPLKNINVVLKLFKSLAKARKIINDFCPDAAVGVGGYASGPVLKRAQKKGIPTLLQEQNSFAGVTNRLLAKKASLICVAYDNMGRFFPEDKIIKTGNPVRKELLEKVATTRQSTAKLELGFNPSTPLVVVIGGSLGARSINESVALSIESWLKGGISVLWQTGKTYYPEYENYHKETVNASVKVVPFINDMGNAYAAADLIISRAGASSISELQLTGKPAVLVPSPNVSEDHQRHNAEALSKIGAAVMILDKDVKENLGSTVLELMDNPQKVKELGIKAADMGMKDADRIIARKVMEIAKSKKNR